MKKNKINKNQNRNWHVKHIEKSSFGQRVADSLATGMGSWSFIIIQSSIILVWIALNFAAFAWRWDPYPFILLNLLFSTQAAYAAPIIMMAQNRQSQRDRIHAEEDYQTNKTAKEEIEELQVALARIENKRLKEIISLLKENSAKNSVRPRILERIDK